MYNGSNPKLDTQWAEFDVIHKAQTHRVNGTDPILSKT
uniref:Uncharacterized protein n=1 Tax=Arabidopsis thaliana TaxID=3702 RepID=Q0WMB0_ARATH|nr:hypothetical protein [Arabidopsis thaliana]